MGEKIWNIIKINWWDKYLIKLTLKLIWKLS